MGVPIPPGRGRRTCRGDRGAGGGRCPASIRCAVRTCRRKPDCSTATANCWQKLRMDPRQRRLDWVAIERLLAGPARRR
ncbi:MAG: hypothetical protein MZV65_43985 [Chromatiales bacterium]|nr:hypothetical protein [Chromatiales bacterium]